MSASDHSRDGLDIGAAVVRMTIHPEGGFVMQLGGGPLLWRDQVLALSEALQHLAPLCKERPVPSPPEEGQVLKPDDRDTTLTLEAREATGNYVSDRVYSGTRPVGPELLKMVREEHLRTHGNHEPEHGDQ